MTWIAVYVAACFVALAVFNGVVRGGSRILRK